MASMAYGGGESVLTRSMAYGVGASVYRCPWLLWLVSLFSRVHGLWWWGVCLAGSMACTERRSFFVVIAVCHFAFAAMY